MQFYIFHSLGSEMAAPKPKGARGEDHGFNAYHSTLERVKTGRNHQVLAGLNVNLLLSSDLLRL